MKDIHVNYTKIIKKIANYKVNHKNNQFQKNSNLDKIRRHIRDLGVNITRNDDLLNSVNLKQKNDEGIIEVIDMFSGCGGMSLGFKAISKVIPAYKLVAAIDINHDSNKTYEKNFGIKPEAYNIEDLLEKPELLSNFISKCRLDPKKPLLLIGCAPCQGFSSHSKWKKQKDERNSLVEVFAKIAVNINPDFIVMENVPELLSNKHWEHFSSFKEILEQKGYFVRAQIVNTAEYGVPQERYRAIVIASKTRFLMPSGVLDKKDFKNVRNTIGDLPKINPGEMCSSDAMHITSKHKKSTVDVIAQVPKNGGNRPKHIGPKWYQDVYGRLSWEKPSITITTNARNPASGRYVHPEQNRGLSKREAALLQSFPKGFIFEGNLSSVFTQIGNAVPPKFSTYLAIHMLGEYLGKPISERLFELDKVYDIQKPIKNSFTDIKKLANTKKEVESIG